MFSLPLTSNLKTRRSSGTPNSRTNRYDRVAARQPGSRSAGGSAVRAMVVARSLKAADELHQGPEATHGKLGGAGGARKRAGVGAAEVAGLGLGVDLVDEGAELVARGPVAASGVGGGRGVQLGLQAVLLAAVEAGTA